MLTALALVASLSFQSTGNPPADSVQAAVALRPTASSVSLTAPVRAEAFAVPSGDEPQMVEYSDGYFTRLTIHKWASYLTVPLFVSEYIIGTKLINGTGSDNTRSIHGALAGAIGGLFVVNTVTGGWNAIEARKDPAEKNRRTIHSVLMLLADAGFVATGMLASESENEGGSYTGPTDNTAHRNMAIASMATALVSYAIMLPPLRRN